MTSLYAALGLLRTHRRLWRYVVVPILVNLTVAAILYATLATTGLRAIERAIGEGQAVTIMLQALVVIALFIVIGFLLARFGIVLGAPWYAKLSEEIELLRTGVDPPSRPALADFARAAVHEARKLALIVATSLALLAVNLVPVAGQLVGTAGGFLLGATVACLDFFDGPLDRAGLSFAQKLRYIARTAPASLGFGLVCAALIVIPLVNLLCLPLCMVAGTIFVTDRPATAGTPRPEAA